MPWYGNTFRNTGPLWGQPTVTGGFTSQLIAMRCFSFLLSVWAGFWTNNWNADTLMQRHCKSPDNEFLFEIYICLYVCVCGPYCAWVGVTCLHRGRREHWYFVLRMLFIDYKYFSTKIAWTMLICIRYNIRSYDNIICLVCQLWGKLWALPLCLPFPTF